MDIENKVPDSRGINTSAESDILSRVTQLHLESHSPRANLHEMPHDLVVSEGYTIASYCIAQPKWIYHFAADIAFL